MALPRLLCEGAPDITEHRRILQLPPVADWSEKNQVDHVSRSDGGRGCYSRWHSFSAYGRRGSRSRRSKQVLFISKTCSAAILDFNQAP